jgi:methyltransferase (TIGR00027 family)
VALSLLPAPLALPLRALRRAPWMGPAVHHALGIAAAGLTYNVELRTRAIDDALAAAVRAGTRQLVLLGAGLDCRAHRLPGLAGVDVFEVDHPAMQRYRQQRFEAAARAARRPHVPLARRVVPVPVDFERERLDETLLGAGFAPREPAFWIWEGVTMYLTPEAIAETLRMLGELSASGSVLALTYAPPGARDAPWLFAAGTWMARAIREPFLGLMTPFEVERALGRAGFGLLSDESAEEWVPRHWPGLALGARPWERLAVARRS